jgi:hypothetical protein
VPDITDEVMRATLATSRPYTVVLLRATAKRREPGADAIVREHGRRNLELRARGLLSIVCPIIDDSDWSGIGVFNATPDEVNAIMAGDPGVLAGIFSYEVHPARSFPGDCLPG